MKRVEGRETSAGVFIPQGGGRGRIAKIRSRASDPRLSDATPNPTIIAGATWRPSKPRLGILRRCRHLRRRPTEDAQVARRSSTNAHVEENAGRCTVHGAR